MFGIYTIVKGKQFYYDSYTNHFTEETKLYNNSGIDCVTYALLMASEKITEMKQALGAIDIIIDFECFICLTKIPCKQNLHAGYTMPITASNYKLIHRKAVYGREPEQGSG